MKEPNDGFEPGEFVYRRRVQFAETDLAGLAHFSCYFRYMEEAEHALFRAAGLSVAGAGLHWPRVAAAGEYTRPLYFENDVDVRLRARFGRRKIEFACVLTHGATAVFTGTMTSVCARADATGTLVPIELPEDVVDRLRMALNSA